MDGSIWLSELQRRVKARLPDVEASRPDTKTLHLSHGFRAIVVYTDGQQALLAPSIALGGPLEERLQDRVKHLDIQQYGLNEATIDVAMDAVLLHLGGGSK